MTTICSMERQLFLRRDKSVKGNSGGPMRYVNPSDVLDKFMRYIKEYDGEMIPKDTAVEELKDALDDAEYEEMLD